MFIYIVLLCTTVAQPRYSHLESKVAAHNWYCGHFVFTSDVIFQAGQEVCYLCWLWRDNYKERVKKDQQSVLQCCCYKTSIGHSLRYGSFEFNNLVCGSNYVVAAHRWLACFLPNSWMELAQHYPCDIVDFHYTRGTSEMSLIVNEIWQKRILEGDSLLKGGGGVKWEWSKTESHGVSWGIPFV